jgi:DNA-binding NarL/FixJ family response regulator
MRTAAIQEVRLPEVLEGRAAVSAHGGQTVLLVDPYPLLHDALGARLATAGIEVVGTANTTAEALTLAERNPPDAILLDIELPGDTEGRIGCIRKLAQRTRAKIIVLTGEPAQVDEAFEAGASAYLLKTRTTQEIVDLVVAVINGSQLDRVQPEPRLHVEPAPLRPLLTRRETEILRLVSEGHTNEQMAAQLWVTQQTVKFHLSNIYRKLGVTNRTQASRWAQVHRITSSSSAG